MKPIKRCSDRVVSDNHGAETHIRELLARLMVEHVRDELSVDRARTVIVTAPPGLRRYPQKVSGDHSE